jgi:hypothetical protein
VRLASVATEKGRVVAQVQGVVTSAVLLCAILKSSSHISNNNNNNNNKVHAVTAIKARSGECRYSSTLSLTSLLDEGVCLTLCFCALTPEMNQCLLYRRLGGPQGRSERVRKISPTPGFDLRTGQPVTSLCTD